MSIKVGDGATHQVGSDAYPYTVIRIINDRTLVVQADDYKVIRGHGNDGTAEYEYTRRPSAVEEVITLRKNGRWYPRGQRGWYCPFSIGFRRAYYDPSF